MDGQTRPDALHDPDGARPRRWKRVLRRTLYTKLAIVGVLVVVTAGIYGRLVFGPLSIGDYSGRVAEALGERIGAGWRVSLSDTSLRIDGTRPSVRALGIEIRNPQGVLVVKAPSAAVSLDPMALLSGTLSPREVELRDLQLRVHLAGDGSLSFVAPGDQGADAPAAGPAPPASSPVDRVDASAVSHAVASLLDPIVRPTSVVGSLDRAAIIDARVTLIGADGRERLAFDKVGALFERAEGGGRRLAIDMNGPRGAWHVSGEVRDTDGTRSADIQADEVPLEDVLLLTGLSSLPTGSDLKLSAHLRARFVDGRLGELAGDFASTAGYLSRPGQSPLRIERLAGTASWNEGARRLDLPQVDVRTAPGEVRLAGTLSPASDGRWTLALAGRDAVLAGATASDPPVRIGEVSAAVAFDESGIALDQALLKGEDLDVRITGRSIVSPGGTGMNALIEARRTSVRRLLSLWPDTVNPELRGYLSENFLSGTVDRMDLRTDLDAEDMKNAFSGKPISDGALALTFSVSDAKIRIVEGLPPLKHLGFTGKATGTATFLAAKQGRIDMPDGRRLTFSDGSYAQVDEHKPGSVAQIAFRLEGGADAVASLLRQPALKEAAPGTIDPAAVKGKADLKVALTLDVHHILAVKDLPISVSGTFSDVAADRIVGREKLEGATVAVNFEAGGLSLKGDGRLGGSPATFELRQPRNGIGDVAVNLVLDEAARSRRSMPSAPQVTGPVAVKLVAPFGPNARGATRIEADLARTAIDGLLPGWTKPAGRPGRISFTLADGTGDGLDLREIVLDSGSVQMRGQAAFTADGILDRADLASLKLSPGDELNAKIDRSGAGYRIVLRGNVGDARPVLKWLGSGSGGGGGPKGKEPPDLDVDLGLAIVTGYNDEALTSVAAKVSTHGRDLRALQVRGQFKAAALDAQLTRRDAGPPVLVLRSADAGATLRFLDLYKRMVGGTLEVETTTGETQSGSISIGGFAVRNEPALRRISAQSVDMGGTDERGTSRTPKFEADQVDFVRLNAEFRRTGSRTEYKDVMIWGPQVGFNLSGSVDYGKDRMDVSGTFVPAYGLNNAFSQLPIVGMILGGGRNEGLIAIEFRVAGNPNSPTLTVNPLTVVAPGILRKLFGWMMPEDETTGATAPPPRPAPAPRPRTR